MIQLIEAPPRSGKTYYFVNYLSRFWDFDALYNEYILDSSVLVISNVEGLKVRHWKYPDCLKGRSVEEFFTIENFEKIMEKTGKNHIILGLDECHEIFPPSISAKTHPELYHFFAYHGHIGLDVFLMTQGVEATSRLFLPLLEFIVKVKPRSEKLYKTFSYHFYSKTGNKLYTKHIKNDKKIFAAYKSFRKDEHNKPKSALVKALAFSIVMLTIGGGLFSYTVHGMMNKGEKPEPAPVKIERFVPPDGSRSLHATPKQVAPISEVTQEVEETSIKWRLYYLEGWLRKSGVDFYIINGRSMRHSDLFRNFSEVTQTVEYYGEEIK